MYISIRVRYLFIDISIRGCYLSINLFIDLSIHGCNLFISVLYVAFVAVQLSYTGHKTMSGRDSESVSPGASV